MVLVIQMRPAQQPTRLISEIHTDRYHVIEFAATIDTPPLDCILKSQTTQLKNGGREKRPRFCVSGALGVGGCFARKGKLRFFRFAIGRLPGAMVSRPYGTGGMLPSGCRQRIVCLNSDVPTGRRSLCRIVSLRCPVFVP